jgi:hypothetical protein
MALLTNEATPSSAPAALASMHACMHACMYICMHACMLLACRRKFAGRLQHNIAHAQARTSISLNIEEEGGKYSYF